MSKKLSKSLICTLSILFIFAALVAQANEEPSTVEDKMTDTTNSNNQLAFSLYREFKNTDGSFSFSPRSINTSLAVLLSAAVENTAEEIAHILKFSSATEARKSNFEDIQNSLIADKVNSVNISTSLWTLEQPPLSTEFVKEINRKFAATISAVDFSGDLEASRSQINAWVAKESRNKIRELFPQGSLPPNSSLVLTNVVYFKGSWAKPFEKTSSSPGIFHKNAESTTNATFMNQSGVYNYAENATTRLLELPYAGESLSLFIALPTKRHSLSEVEEELNNDSLNSLRANFVQHLGNISIPRFRLESQPDLQSALEKLGMKDSFSSNAKFNNFTNRENDFYLATTIHKSVIEVNEEGTEAAAATGFVTAAGMPTTKPLEFVADEPFIFMIYHKPTSSILFIGRIANVEN